MSRLQISRSPDLAKLLDEGYDIDVVGGYMVVRRVPYLDARGAVQLGTLVSELTLAGDVTTAPGTHVMHFAGEYPCHSNGSPIEQIWHQSGRNQLDTDLIVDHSFSSKPQSGGYADYYEKVTTYAAILSSPAAAVDPTVTPHVYPVVEERVEDSVFRFVDTASSRAGISIITRKLRIGKLAIVGLGGTGAYVLDYVAKTPVADIHLYDGDRLRQHNAFRAPGAISVEDLRTEPWKATYYQERYRSLRRGIHAHPYFITPDNATELQDFDFVFLCVDDAAAKRPIIQALDTGGVPYIDVGMGVHRVDDSLVGVLRVTTSTPQMRAHIERRVSCGGGADNDYAENIQIAELNAMNAALAVIRWKKLLGFYLDLEHEHNSTYTLDGNALMNDDHGP